MMENNKPTPHVKVFVTKTQKFRAKIRDARDLPYYEVTIGGVEWNKGKGRQHEAKILSKCQGIIAGLKKELKVIRGTT